MKRILFESLAVGAGGFIGSLLRLGVATVFGAWLQTDFPVGTLVINLSGSMFLGWFLTVLSNGWNISDKINPDTLRLAVGVGFVGAYTTFSTYMYESNKLVRDGEFYKAALNLVGSLLLGLLAVRAGIWLGNRGRP